MFTESPETFEFDYCKIGINTEMTCCGGISLTFTQTHDNEANPLPADKVITHYNDLDNHQAYEIAMALLASIDVRDTRGSK